MGVEKMGSVPVQIISNNRIQGFHHQSFWKRFLDQFVQTVRHFPQGQEKHQHRFCGIPERWKVKCH